MRELKFKKYGIQGVMIGLLYLSFGYLRIYKFLYTPGILSNG